MVDTSERDDDEGDDEPDDGAVFGADEMLAFEPFEPVEPFVPFEPSNRLGMFGMLLVVVRNLRGSTTCWKMVEKPKNSNQMKR